MQINKDCSESLQGFMNKNSCNATLSPLIQRLVNVERDCLMELRGQVDTAFGDPADAMHLNGEIYRSWQKRMEVPAPREKDIAFCERRIRELADAYHKALQSGAELSEQMKNMLQHHIERVKETFALVLQYKKERADRTEIIAQ